MSKGTPQSHFFLALLLATLALTILILLPYLNVLVLAVTFAVIFYPVHHGIRRALGRWEGLAAFLSILVVLVVVFVPLTFFGITVFHEAQGLYGTIASGGGELFTTGARRLVADQPWLHGFAADLSSNLAAYTSRVLDVVLQSLGPIVSGIGQALFVFLLTLIALYYLFRDGHRLEEAFVGISPLPEASSRKILDRLHATATSVVRGALIIVVLQGLIVGLGFLIFGVPNAAIWGLVTVFAALVPMVGVLVTVIPAAIYLSLTAGALPAVGFFLWSYVIAGAAENFLRPRLIKHGAGIHPFLILISILGGISVFGAIGFLMGPLVLSLFFALLDLHSTVAREAEG